MTGSTWGRHAFGPPVTRSLFVRAPTTYDFFRFNRVEGLYLGVAGTLFFRDKVPGLALRGGVGYGFWDQEVKGGLVATLRRGRWFGEVTGEHELAIVTKFRDPLDYAMGTRPIFAQDLYDYADRLMGQVGGGFGLEKHRSGVLRADFGVVKDKATPQELSNGPLGQNYYGNPTVDAGTYFRSRVSLIWREDVSSHFARPGIGAQVYVENGQGDFQYTSVNARVVARRERGRLAVQLRRVRWRRHCPDDDPDPATVPHRRRLHTARLRLRPVRRQPGATAYRPDRICPVRS